MTSALVGKQQVLRSDLRLHKNQYLITQIICAEMISHRQGVTEQQFTA